MLRALILGTVLALSAGSVGCGSNDDARPPRDPRKVTSAMGDTGHVVAGNNAFACSVYAEASKQPGNVFVSPFSVSAALALVYAGAAGNTAKQMHDAMHVGLDDAAWHAAFGALLQDLGGPHAGRGYQLLIANALFGQRGFDFAKPYLDLTSADYGATLTPLDFASDPDGARGQVNGWISERTAGQIPELIPAGSLDSSAVLVAANAIYFHAAWATAFDRQDTRPDSFTRDDGSVVEVPMMYGHGDKAHYRRTKDAQVTAFELPYMDGEVSMLILLPNDPQGLPAFEAQLGEKELDALVSNLADGEFDLQMPKWTVQFELPLVAALKAAGITDAFDPALADLSGIASSEKLWLSGAWHQAYVDVDEEGTTAAAATAVESSRVSAPMLLRVDHPFVYLIRDRLTGSILFVGRVADPTAQG